jgi:hypothetical protein
VKNHCPVVLHGSGLHHHLGFQELRVVFPHSSSPTRASTKQFEKDVFSLFDSLLPLSQLRPVALASNKTFLPSPDATMNRHIGESFSFSLSRSNYFFPGSNALASKACSQWIRTYESRPDSRNPRRWPTPGRGTTQHPLSLSHISLQVLDLPCLLNSGTPDVRPYFPRM